MTNSDGTSPDHTSPDGTSPDGLDLPEHRWVANVVVEREGRVLLLRRRDARYLGGQWDLPGGTVEEGETTAEAARREALEEAGLHVRIDDVLSHVTNPDTRGRPICFHTVTYRGTEHDLTTPVVLAAEEHDRHEWVAWTAAGDHDLVWHVRRALTAMDHEPGGCPGLAR